MQKKYKVIFLVYFFLHFTAFITAKNAVMYTTPQGRLGDQILTYIKAKWLAWKYQYDFLFTPFKYSQFLMCHHQDTHITPQLKKNFNNTHSIKNESAIQNNNNNNDLFNVSFYFSSFEWQSNLDHYLWYGLTDNNEFRNIIRSSIAPHYTFQKLALPHNTLTVALHVRKGGGHDSPLYSKKNDQLTDNTHIKKKKPSLSRTKQVKKEMKRKREKRQRSQQYADKNHPFKFPPDSFYIDALRILSKELDESFLYVYIFTDDKNPEKIAKKYSDMLDQPNIIFDYRKTENGPNAHVLDDLFNMARFDYLIRPESNFSKIADIIGYHSIILFPHSIHWDNNILCVPEITMVKNNVYKIISNKKETVS